jgi:hypothetical protein
LEKIEEEEDRLDRETVAEFQVRKEKPMNSNPHVIPLGKFSL